MGEDSLTNFAGSSDHPQNGDDYLMSDNPHIWPGHLYALIIC